MRALGGFGHGEKTAAFFLHLVLGRIEFTLGLDIVE